MHRSQRTLGLLLLTVVALTAFGVDLGRPALWDPGEGRYGQTVREMMASGRWLVPTLSDVPYLDKPPVFFWMIAASFHAFGMHEWAARLPSALAALAIVMATVAFAWRRVGTATAIGAGIVLSTGGQFVALGRTVRLDMMLTLCLTLTLFRAYALWTDERHDAGRTWPLYVLPAFGLLIKGPIAILLPVLIVGVLTVVTGEYERVRRWRPGPGLLVAALVAGTWYVPAAIWSPEYLATFLWQQNVARFLGASTGHPEPIWYFLWVLPVTFLPWTLFLPGTLRRTLHRARQGHDLDLFLGIWVIVTVVFFSASRAKLATYVLPVFPALAVLVARYLAVLLASGPTAQARALRLPGWIWTSTVGLVALGAPVVAAVAFPAYVVPATASLLLIPIVVAAALALRHGHWRTVPLVVAGGGLLLQILFFRVAAPIVDEFMSLRHPAQLARALPTETTMFVYKTRGHSFAFYDGRRLTRVRAPAEVAARLDAASPAAVLTKEKYLARLRPHLTQPACIWWHGASGRVLLANVPPQASADVETLAPDGWQTEPGRPPCWRVGRPDRAGRPG